MHQNELHSMWTFIANKMEQFKTAILFDNHTTITYSQAILLSQQHANNLSRKLSPKSKCAILCGSGLQCAILLLACWRADMIPIPMSMNYGESHCKKIIELTQPDVLITDCNDDGLFCFRYDLRNQTFEGDIASAEHNQDLEDVAVIMCTSGTTGDPKGIMITLIALQQNILKISHYFDITAEDTIMIARPLYHCAVLTGEFLVALRKGLNIAFFDGTYHPSSVLMLAVKHKITVVCGTPTLFNHLSAFVQRKHVTHSINKIAISGECLNKKIASNIRKGFLSTKIYHVYGLTETSPRVSYLPPEKFDHYPESVGLPLQDIKIKIVNKEGVELKINEHGLIAVKSPCAMKGYYKNQSATQNVLVDGWINTGDIGYKDENGYLYILSRADDMIIKAGMNIYPKEVENQIANIDQILECVAYGKNTSGGQMIALDIVLRNRETTKKALMSLLVAQLPAYQMPSEINIVDAIRTNASGKILRRSDENDNARN